jgi:hypothetical protein
MKISIGEITSRIRKIIKAIKQDAFLTDRFLYSLLVKHGNWLMKREDSANKLLKFDPVIEALPFVELIEVDKVEAQCHGVQTHCKIKRTANKLPAMFEGYSSVLIRTISSLDGGIEVVMTDPITYVNITRQTSFKYNKTKYCWFLNGYLYFPNIEWDAVRVEGIFSEDVENYGCPDCKNCKPRQKHPFNIPGYLHGELENFVLNDLKTMLQIPTDTANDKQSITR